MFTGSLTRRLRRVALCWALLLLLLAPVVVPNTAHAGGGQPDSYAYLSGLPLYMEVGKAYTADLRIETGSWEIGGQQQYMSVSPNLRIVSVVADTSVFDFVVETGACNQDTSCTLHGRRTLPPHSWGVASGINVGEPPVRGDYKVAHVTLMATAPGPVSGEWTWDRYRAGGPIDCEIVVDGGYGSQKQGLYTPLSATAVVWPNQRAVGGEK